MNKLHLILFILFYPCMSLSMQNQNHYCLKIWRKPNYEKLPELLKLCHLNKQRNSIYHIGLIEFLNCENWTLQNLRRYLYGHTEMDFRAIQLDDNKKAEIDLLIEEEERKFFPDFEAKIWQDEEVSYAPAEIMYLNNEN